MRKKLLKLCLSLMILMSCSRGFQNAYEQLNDPVVQQPTVSTEMVSNITAVSAISGGVIPEGNNAPVLARGVCWDTKTGANIQNSCTNNGKGSGSFASSLTGLSPNTTYYVRAYVTYKAGTNYGEEHTFSTPNSINDITEYKFLKSLNSSLTADAVGVIAEQSANVYTITVKVSSGAVLTSLIASFSYIGGSIKISTASQISASTVNNFTSSQTYTVTALSGETRTFIVTVYYSYQVLYDSNGADSGLVPTDNQKYITGESVTVSDNAGNLIKSGFSFNGWNTQSNGSGTSYPAGSAMTIGSADVTLYAQWSSLAAYTIAYKSGNGSGSDYVSGPYLPGAPVTILNNSGLISMSYAGYIFSGWGTNTSGGTLYAPGALISMPASNLILYAQWSPLSIYTIKYYSDSTTLLTSVSYYQGQAVIIADNNSIPQGSTYTINLVNSGHSFLGWDTTAACSGIPSYLPLSSITMSENLTLFACWSN